jgi:hypothetical protein
MIPREEILKQINRFYDMVESIDKQIEQRKDIPNETDPVEMDINFKLLRTYFKLTSKVGTKMQDAIDDLKTQLDIIEDKNEDISGWIDDYIKMDDVIDK